MRRLENYDQSQFWEAWIRDDTVLCHRSGRVGSPGHVHVEKFSSRAETESALQAHINEKLEEAWQDLGEQQDEDDATEEMSLEQIKHYLGDDASNEIEPTEGATVESSVHHFDPLPTPAAGAPILSPQPQSSAIFVGLNVTLPQTDLIHIRKDLVVAGRDDEDEDDSSDEEDEDEEDDDSSDNDDDDDDDDDGDEDEDGDDDDDENDGDDDENDGDDDEDEDDEDGDDEDGDDEDDDDDSSEDDEDEVPLNVESERAPQGTHTNSFFSKIPHPPPAPRLPVRLLATSPTSEGWNAASKAFGALMEEKARRSWKRSGLARKAKRALSKLGGIDPVAHEALASHFSAAMSDATASHPRVLTLSAALGLLYVADAAVFRRTVRQWSSVSQNPLIQTLYSIVEHIPNDELALHIGVLFADRKLPGPTWRKRFDHIYPLLNDALGQSNISMQTFLTALGTAAVGDPILVARIEEAAR